MGMLRDWRALICFGSSVEAPGMGVFGVESSGAGAVGALVGEVGALVGEVAAMAIVEEE